MRTLMCRRINRLIGVLAIGFFHQLAVIQAQTSGPLAGATPAGTFDQVAAQAGWKTTFYLYNSGMNAAQARLNTFDNNGNPLVLPFSFPLSGSGPVQASTLDETLNPGQLLAIEASGPDTSPLLVGWGQLLTNGSISGFAIFHYDPTGQEAVVPLETRSASSYFLAVDDTAPLVTGLALANHFAQAGNFTVTLRGDTGSEFGTYQTLSLPAMGHTSFNLTQNASFAAIANGRGTIEVDGPPGQVGMLGLRGNGNAVTTLPVMVNANAPGSMGHLAFNNGWETYFTLTNTGSTSAQATVNFFDANGNPLSVPLLFPQTGATQTTATVSQLLSPGASLLMQTQGNDVMASVAGSAQLMTTGNVSGFAIFHYNNGQEAVVPLETRASGSYILAFDNTNGSRTGIALSEIAGEAPNVGVVIRDASGAVVQNSSLQLTAHSHQSFLIENQFPVATNLAGTIEFDAPAGSIATLGILFRTSGAFTSVPPFVKFPPTPTNALFVAPNGSDSNPGTIDRPFLTIQKCATTATQGWTCELRAGTYGETVTPNSGITITSYHGESVTVDGSDPVTGWTLYQGSIYEASANLSTGDTNQVFVGNQMMTEARWPNGDDLFHVNWATAHAGTTTTQIVDSNLPNINWTGAKIHLWSGSDPWAPQTGTVTASQAGQVTFSVDGASNPPYIVPTVGGYYYLFGILGALDAQREWFYDSSAGVLYFWAPGGVDPGTLDVRAKQRQYAFDLSGKSSVTIQNINIVASTINSDFSSTNNVMDGINAQYVSQFTSLPDPPGYPGGYIADHIGDSGIIINGTGNTLLNSTIAYSAGNGVVVISGSNVVRNNLIHHINYIGIDLAGIVVLGNNNPLQNSTIQNNTIHTLGRQAILIQYWTGNVQNADISYNNLFNSMILSRDGGEIYACCSPLVATGTRIHHNWIHDTQSLISGAASNYPASGVYIDNGSAGFEVDQNVIWNNQYENILIHGNGVTTPNDNNVHNNSIPDINSSAYVWLFQIPNCGTTRVVDNLALVPVNNVGNDPACTVTNNNSTAPGATEMTSSVQVGCSFAGCSFSGPPAISGSSVAASITVQPRSVTVVPGQTATFSVTAAGSPTLSYQWQKNGVNIAGAISASYTTPATTSADNGAIFTVQASNPVGKATSNPATLTFNVPGASLTASGEHNLLVGVGATINYQWSSAGAVSATSSYTVDGAGPYSWVANSLDGSTSGVAATSQVGHTYVITYTVMDSSGRTASDQITVSVGN